MLQASQKVLLGSSSWSSADPLAGLWLPSLALPPPAPTLPPSASGEEVVPSRPTVASAFTSALCLVSDPLPETGSECVGEAEAALLVAPPCGEVEAPAEGTLAGALLGSAWCRLEQ